MARVVRVAQRTLPQADVAAGDVQVAHLGAELLLRNMFANGPLQSGPDAPALADADSRADVAQAHHQVDDPVDVLGHAVAPLDADPVLVAEHDLLARIIEARLNQQRPALLLEGQL